MAKNSFAEWSTTAASNTDVGGINIDEGCPPSNVNNAMRTIMAQLASGVDGEMAYSLKSADYTAVLADKNVYFRFTATATLSLTAAASLGTSWHCIAHADGGIVMVDPNASETINGALTITIANGQAAFIICNGTAFFAIIIPNVAAANTWTGTNTFSASQSFTSGIAFGSTNASSVTDLSKHIALYGTNHGFSITASRLNYNVPTGVAHKMVVNGVDVASVDSAGVTITGTLTVTG